MPINIPQELPARHILEKENIFWMDTNRATTQDIRPLHIVILNLMPEKETAETQLLRLLGNTPLQVNITFLHTATHKSKNVSRSHLEHFYATFDEIKDKHYDGMIMTGAPVERLAFGEVNYWHELTKIMDWSLTHVTSTLHICWGAQAALYYHYGIDKVDLPQKCTGIFRHNIIDEPVKLLRGFDEEFLAPHSRYTDVLTRQVENHDALTLLSTSETNAPFIMMSKDERHILVTGHLEYDADSLAEEYSRDQANGDEAVIPHNYFPNDDPEQRPLHRWRSHAHLLFSNWLNYYVYQETPFDWSI